MLSIIIFSKAQFVIVDVLYKTVDVVRLAVYKVGLFLIVRLEIDIFEAIIKQLVLLYGIPDVSLA